MKFNSGTSRRSVQRRARQVSAPAEVEVFEQRLVLSPTVLTPAGTVSTATPEITWTPEANAVSYDVWISSLESFKTLHIQKRVIGTSYTPAELPLGSTRIWVRSNFQGGTSSAWSVPKDTIVQPAPQVNGPVGFGIQHVTSDGTPLISWYSANTARRFQIRLTDVVNDTSKDYFVENLTPRLNAAGQQVLDAQGNVIRDENRTLRIPEADSLPIGQYEVQIRSLDQGSRLSQWSNPYEFQVGTAPRNLKPSGITFQTKPLLQWDTVAGATHYELYVARQNFGQAVTAPPSSYTLLYRQTLSTNSFQIPTKLAAGGYVFWVRAINDTKGAPVVYGLWTSPVQFSTLIAPVITGPVPVGGVVSSARPTVEWTPIDGAARYEVYVHKFNSRAPFLQTNSSTNSFTFTERLAPSKYNVWVRAIDSRGNFSPWSASYQIVTTGGAPQVISPTAGQRLNFPEYRWTPVEDAASYEIWVAHLGVDFTFINVSGITGTSYSANPINPGTYRVWVRAIFADGSKSVWSAPVTFTGIASAEPEQQPDSLLASIRIAVTPESSAAVESTASAESDGNVHQPRVAELQLVQWVPEDIPEQQAARRNAAERARREETRPNFVAPPSLEERLPDVALPLEDLARIAQECIRGEWWESSEVSG